MSLGLGLGLNLYQKQGWSPTALFPSGTVGGWYEVPSLADNAISTRVWQDSARTTPVTASGQPVGAIDDLSGNGRHLLQATAAARPTYLAGDTPATFGTELTTNGTFSADTNWTKGGTWTISGGTANAGGSSGSLSQTVSLTAGKLYRVVFTVSAYVTGTLTPNLSGGTTANGAATSANGTYTQYIRAETGNTTFGFTASGSPSMSLDNVSVMEVLTLTGYPCLRFDGVDDCMAESSTHTLSLPVYVVAAYNKSIQDSISFFGSILDASNNTALVNVNANSRAASTLRSTARGSLTPNSTNNEWPVATIAVLDTLSITGTTDIKVNNNAAVTSANTWIGGDTVAASKIRLAGLATTFATSGYFFGGLVLLADPGSSGRARCKTYFGIKVGLNL